MLARIPLKVAAYANKAHKEVKNQNMIRETMLKSSDSLLETLKRIVQ